jgi:hypothetical protein
MTALRIDYADEAERDRKMVSIMQSLGFHVTRLPIMLTVRQLARIVTRGVPSVSRSLHGAETVQKHGF